MSGRKARWYKFSPAAAVLILGGAAALIRDKGWTQGRLRDQGGSLCIEAAIRDAGGDDATGIQTAMACVRYALNIPHDTIRSLFDWNDVPGRRESDVLDALAGGEEEAERMGLAMEVNSAVEESASETHDTAYQKWL